MKIHRSSTYLPRFIAPLLVVFPAVIGCGSSSNESGGSAGSQAGSGGTGAAGTGGSAGVSGSSGSSGSAGVAGDAGSAGVGGSAGSAATGGSAGSSGSSGTGGTAGTAGSAGSAGTAGTAGTAGSGGSAGIGGSAGAGAFGGGAGSAGASGSSGSAGSGGTGGAPAVCGNGLVELGEACDDGATAAGDGCAPDCSFETGFVCSGSPSVCVLAVCVLDCGPTELCSPEHLGFDDNCNGFVDEGCTCKEGETHSCFKGNPADLSNPACHSGTMTCTENGVWGPCEGGFHSLPPDSCTGSGAGGCHPISSTPFATVNLKDGTGNFSANATAESWTVTCPAGVSPCPTVSGSAPADDFKPLQSGEYTVTYTKTVGGSQQQCTYPLFVGSRGIRVELQWEHTAADSGVDLDLHVHQPSDTQPWGISGVPQDCTWSNCVFSDFQFAGASTPHWFPDANAVPDPVNWYLDPLPENNTCYSSPRGVGAQWSGYGQGCHNPRLDLDNITCNFSQTDSNATDFCAPENVNIDFPPLNEWIRIGVHYYSAHSLSYPVHPTIKVFCDGQLGGEIGPNNFYSPSAPVTFVAADSSTRFWVAADVAKVVDQCGRTTCTVKPVYADEAAKTPYFTTRTQAEAAFAPPYPPLP